MSPSGKKRPNILVIVTDGERASKTLPPALGLPARRRLAAAGTTFVNYQTNALACGPARSVLYTGQHILQTGVFDNPGGGPGRRDLDTSRYPTLGQLLQAAGYFTAYKGKWHLGQVIPEAGVGYRHALRRHGFDEWQQLGDYYGSGQEGNRLDPVFAADAARWLQERGPDIAARQPWLLCVNLINPHDVMYFDATGHQEASRLDSGGADPMLPAVRVAPYQEQPEFALPPSFEESLGSKPRAHVAFNEHSDLMYGEIAPTDRDSWRRYQNYYFDCLRDVDLAIARVLDGLRDSGQERNTIVVFTADHGEMGGAHRMRTKGPVIYKEALDVPMVIVHPHSEGGREARALAGSLDIVPTLLGFAGIDTATRESRYPFLKGQDQGAVVANPQIAGPRDERGNLLVFSAVHASNPQAYRLRVALQRSRSRRPKFPEDFIDWSTRSFYRGVADGHYRFARYFSPSNHHSPDSWQALLAGNDLELYDDREDPQNLTNLAAEPLRYRELIETLNRKLLLLLQQETSAPDDGRHMPGPLSLWSGHG